MCGVGSSYRALQSASDERTPCSVFRGKEDHSFSRGEKVTRTTPYHQQKEGLCLLHVPSSMGQIRSEMRTLGAVYNVQGVVSSELFEDRTRYYE